MQFYILSLSLFLSACLLLFPSRPNYVPPYSLSVSLIISVKFIPVLFILFLYVKK